MTEYSPYTIIKKMQTLYNKMIMNKVMIQLLLKVNQLRGKSENLYYTLEVKTVKQQVLIELPFHLGKKQIQIPPSIPDGSLVCVQIEIFVKMKVPTGVNLIIKAGGIKIFNQNFGLC